ncbi:FliM/FliN family flagellar motor switch protein [Shewanella waksmanii]|uniref:FliM/FliN family flagellar motor switch protein n=1 Tax=Shewanella waksmanii TaxID=213783 RepID=UPI00048B4B97|nr:flagellar motor switch protein FliM [Shewanella waksmanii]
MKITSKARLIKNPAVENIRPVVLIKEKLARSRLIIQIESCQKQLIENINTVLNPIIRQGHHGVYEGVLSTQDQTVTPDIHGAWFLLSYQGSPLAWWRIDRCTLDQLASGYYGSVDSPLCSPLREPSQSEFRLAKKLMLAALSALPVVTLDEHALQLSLVTNQTPLDAPFSWQLSFPQEQCGADMRFCMTEKLLGLMAEQPSHYMVAADLPEQLAQRLSQIPTKILLELGRQVTPVTSLSNLSVGDILPMSLHSRCPVTVGKRPLFYATVHTHDGQMVAKLTQDAFPQEEIPHD